LRFEVFTQTTAGTVWQNRHFCESVVEGKLHGENDSEAKIGGVGQYFIRCTAKESEFVMMNQFTIAYFCGGAD